MKDQIKNEVIRFNKFQKSILGIKGNIEVQDIDVRNYAKYILKDGGSEEKRELASCFKTKIVLKEKIITFVKQ